MEALAVITGAGSGIGRALAEELDACGYRVVGIGRQREKLEATEASCSKFTTLAADIADPSARQTIATQLQGRSLAFLIHNAGRLEPVGDLTGISYDDWRQTVAVNMEAPLFLTQNLLSLLAPGARVLTISSGAAHRALRGWGTYCATKAGAYMLYQLLAEELRDRDVAVGSLRPGVVDTPMQAHIRALSPADFPAVERFRALKTEGALVDPRDVARFARALLMLQDGARFSSAEWDIREHWDALC